MRLIDADKLKNEVNSKRVVGRFNTILLIDNAPTVEERPTGEWIYHGNRIECNQCRVWFLKDFLIRNSFCPNCGADMRVKDELKEVPKERLFNPYDHREITEI